MIFIMIVIIIIGDQGAGERRAVQGCPGRPGGTAVAQPHWCSPFSPFSSPFLLVCIYAIFTCYSGFYFASDGHIQNRSISKTPISSLSPSLWKVLNLVQIFLHHNHHLHLHLDHLWPGEGAGDQLQQSLFSIISIVISIIISIMIICD